MEEHHIIIAKFTLLTELYYDNQMKLKEQCYVRIKEIAMEITLSCNILEIIMKITLLWHKLHYNIKLYSHVKM